MSLGHRTYIIEGDRISPLAQMTFDEFFFNERPALGAYSGRTLTFAMPMYELENRRPAPSMRKIRQKRRWQGSAGLRRSRKKPARESWFT